MLLHRLGVCLFVSRIRLSGPASAPLGSPRKFKDELVQYGLTFGAFRTPHPYLSCKFLVDRNRELLIDDDRIHEMIALRGIPTHIHMP
uniref:Secreted protein n=1 Tax=Steinernema glaseri TaxID=37863 RepID=A0A1I7YQZ7_9BILA